MDTLCLGFLYFSNGVRRGFGYFFKPKVSFKWFLVCILLGCFKISVGSLLWFMIPNYSKLVCIAKGMCRVHKDTNYAITVCMNNKITNIFS